MAPMTRIYFIRHGETAWSLDGRHTGRSDIPLTHHGEEEAHALVPVLKDIAFTHVFTSALRRARQTCDLAGLGARSQIDPDLSEWNYGDYEGRSTTDIHDERPGWSVWRDGSPGGETPADVAGRADAIIRRLLLIGGHVALFSHGQFGGALAARWIELAVVEGQRFVLDPASVSILAHEPGHPEVRVIALWNVVPPRPMRDGAQIGLLNLDTTDPHESLDCR